LEDTTEKADKEILSKTSEEKIHFGSPAAAPQISRQNLKPLFYLSPQQLHLAPVLYFQVRFKLFQALFVVSMDSRIETAFHCDEGNSALHLAAFGQKTTGDFPKVRACSQCCRGVDGFVGHDGSLENGLIDAADIAGPEQAHVTLKGLTSNGQPRHSKGLTNYADVLTQLGRYNRLNTYHGCPQ
jgi:hypothetical protein